MNYFLDLFSPETYEAFARSDMSVSGFRERHRGVAGRVKPGDRLLCYMTKASRWFGILDVLDGPYIDASPIFAAESDPFIVRFLSHDSIRELAQQPHLAHLSDTVLDEYEEEAEV